MISNIPIIYDKIMKMLMLMIFSAGFIIVFWGCTPIPPLNGVKIENQSSETILVYTQRNPTGTLIEKGNVKYLKINEGEFFFIYLPQRECSFKYALIEMGYSIGNGFGLGSGRYLPLIWTISNQLYLREGEGKCEIQETQSK